VFEFDIYKHLPHWPQEKRAKKILDIAGIASHAPGQIPLSSNGTCPEIRWSPFGIHRY
jgi:hypothetical protein